MHEGDRPRFNWLVVLIFGPVILGWFVVRLRWPRATGPYIVAVGVIWIVALVSYLVIREWRERHRRGERR